MPDRKSLKLTPTFVTIILASWLLQISILDAGQNLPCIKEINPTDSFLVADADGKILCAKNETRQYIPASTIKLLTALAAIHNLGRSYRFRTEFYMDVEHNLKIKGYGDPLLISEVWQEIADTLAEEIHDFENLILDDTYFSQPVIIPGCNQSTNPYDAPVGALCANFNTVFFDRDQQGRIIPAEPQTPMIPFARQRIRTLGLKKGRYVFIRDHEEAARYAGELLLYLLKQRGVKSRGGIRLGATDPEDRLVYVYRSKFTLENAIKKMMEFSSNFVANQIFVALGASVYGPPGTVGKGVEAVSAYARKHLDLEDAEIFEGSGISRKNHFSALDMLTILKQFKPYRHLLNKKDRELYKTGSLKGVRARVGYREENDQKTYYFVIFSNRTNPDTDCLMKCIRRFLTARIRGVR